MTVSRIVEVEMDKAASRGTTTIEPRGDPCPANDRSKVEADYRAKLTEMSDDAFVSEVERKVWLSAFASNNPRAPAHWQCDATWDESRRREKPWLYQRGWNYAYQSCGHEPSDAEVAAALGNSDVVTRAATAREGPPDASDSPGRPS